MFIYVFIYITPIAWAVMARCFYVDYELIKDFPYLALVDELWSVFCEHFMDKKYHK